ncbi:MAG TPA: sugar ABC transporter permease [Trueperaceae bacterium]|nr:sugar ABC transporter permease [Trueperaceae bacterium]
MPRSGRELLPALLFLSPFLVVLAIFFVYASARAVYFSFTDYDLFNAPKWVGLENYRALFKDDNFLYALRNSLVFAAVVTAVQTAGALVTASALNRRVRGMTFFRSAFYMPAVTSSVVITLIFLWLFQRLGGINYLITAVARNAPAIGLFVLVAIVVQAIQVVLERRRWRGATGGASKRTVAAFDPALLVVSLLVAAAATIGLGLLGYLAPRGTDSVAINWLQTRQEVPNGAPFFLRAPLPLVAIMVQNTFTTIPTFMLMFLAALQDVPRSYYEAAALDGANPAQQFFYITVPSLQPVIFLVVSLGLIGTLQMFDQVAIFGSAVPLQSVITLAYFVYNRMFPGAQLPEVGFASAAAMFLAALTLVIVLLQRTVLRAEGDR